MPTEPHLHFLGIAGSFMAGVAKLATELGYEVSGSDTAFYPPAGNAVRALGVPLFKGYDATCADRPADLYIIGNFISRGNPLAEDILRRRRPYQSAPQWLAENILRQRRVCAVAGTHGKTTTASLLTYLLDNAGLNPGFLLGGSDQNFGQSARLAADSEWFVIEADEYDCAFFDKRPKFIHYHPDILIINNLEFDHADIYPDLDAIIRQFHFLLRTVPDNGRVIARADCPNTAAAVAQGCWTPIEWLDNDWQWRETDSGKINITHRQKPQATITPPLTGKMNRDNFLAAAAAAAAAGVPTDNLQSLINGFVAPCRRLQPLHRGAVTLYDDFAHHPTAIAATLAAIAETRPARIIAAFERGSNTMNTDIFRARLAPAFAAADVLIAVGPDDDWLRDTFAGRQAPFFSEPDAEAAAGRILTAAAAGDAVVLMSNRDFGSLAGCLTAALRERERTKKI